MRVIYNDVVSIIADSTSREDIIIAAHGYIGAVDKNVPQQIFEHVFCDPVIWIHKTDVITSGDIQPGITRIGQTAVGFMNDTNSRIPGGKLIAYRTGVIGRAVIHQNDLQVFIGLRENTVQAGTKILLHVINRNDYTDQLIHINNSR